MNPVPTAELVVSTMLTISACAGKRESSNPSISRWYLRCCDIPAGFTVMASLAVEMAACAPPIAVARGRSTKGGHGAPGSFTLLSARAAAPTASSAAMNARIRGAVYCWQWRGARKRLAPAPPLSGRCANKGPAGEEEHGAVWGGRCYLRGPAEVR